MDAAGAGLQRLCGPRLGALFARLRNAVEGPFQLPGEHVVSANVAWSRVVAGAACRKRNDHRVLIYTSRIAAWPPDRTVRIGARVHATAVSKGHDGFAGPGIDLFDVAAIDENQPA